VQCRDRTAERAPRCTQDPARRSPTRQGPCSGVTAKSPRQLVRMWRHEATREENGEDRGPDRDHTVKRRPPPQPPSQAARPSHLPRSRALPPSAHAPTRQPAARPADGALALGWCPDSGGVAACSAAARGPRVRRRAADGWIRSNSGAAGERDRTSFRFSKSSRGPRVRSSPLACSHVVRPLLDLPWF
jgi:hypothetical protein